MSVCNIRGGINTNPTSEQSPPPYYMVVPSSGGLAMGIVPRGVLSLWITRIQCKGCKTLGVNKEHWAVVKKHWPQKIMLVQRDNINLQMKLSMATSGDLMFCTEATWLFLIWQQGRGTSTVWLVNLCIVRILIKDDSCWLFTDLCILRSVGAGAVTPVLFASLFLFQESRCFITVPPVPSIHEINQTRHKNIHGKQNVLCLTGCFAS